MAHHALSIIDILRLVFDQIRDDKLTLSRLARCCRAFHNPALDILWKNLSSDVPLLALLPPVDGSGPMVVIFNIAHEVMLTVIADS